MLFVSGVLIFAGYQMTTYGWSQVRGANAGFFDLLWPGRYKGDSPDGGKGNVAGIVQTPTGLNDIAAGGTVGTKSPPPPGSALGSATHGGVQ